MVIMDKKNIYSGRNRNRVRYFYNKVTTSEAGRKDFQLAPDRMRMGFVESVIGMSDLG